MVVFTFANLEIIEQYSSMETTSVSDLEALLSEIVNQLIGLGIIEPQDLRPADFAIIARVCNWSRIIV